MAWLLPNGKVINTPRPITVNDVLYPLTIFYRWSKEELAAIGIKPWREVRFDQKWYKSTGYSDEEVDGEIIRTHTLTEKHSVARAKEIRNARLREQYISFKTRAENNADFYDAVGDSDAKKVWTDYVTTLKNEAKTLKESVDNAGSYDDIVNLNINWTVIPDDGGPDGI